MNARSKIAAGLLLSWLVFFAAVGLAVVWYGLPKPEWIRIGWLEDYPPSTEPYPITSMDRFVYLVNDGQQVIVLEPMMPQLNHFTATWRSQEGKFRDPLRGSEYNLYGIPKWRGKDGLENQSLPRYPVKVEKGVIYIDFTQSEVIKYK